MFIASILLEFDLWLVRIRIELDPCPKTGAYTLLSIHHTVIK